VVANKFYYFDDQASQEKFKNGLSKNFPHDWHILLMHHTMFYQHFLKLNLSLSMLNLAITFLFTNVSSCSVRNSV